MKKAGKIIAAIFASICIVVSLITLGVGFTAKAVQEDPDAFKEGMQQLTAGADVPESEKEDVDASMEGTTDFLLNMDHKKMSSQGVVGAILSLIILVTVLINVPKMPIVTPAIASVASLGGAIYCGWLIMFFMGVALIGSVLVLIANLKQDESSSKITE